MDLKYDLLRHPNIIYSPDGGAKPYVHRNRLYYGNPLFSESTDSYQNEKENLTNEQDE
jgi:hypothetical protein